MAPPARTRIGADPESGRKRGRPTDGDSRETRAKILHVALRRFGQASYSDVSLVAIAAECLVDKRTLHYHFGSKRGLFEAVLEQAFGRFIHEVRTTVFVHPTARARLAAYVDVYRRLHTSDPVILHVIGRSVVDGIGSSDLQGPLIDVGAELLLLLVEIVDEAIAGGELNPAVDRHGAVRVLSAISMGLSLMSMADPGPYPATLAAFDLIAAGDFFVDAPAEPPISQPRRAAGSPPRR
jgi:AcrR family transcriptional regulator